MLLEIGKGESNAALILKLTINVFLEWESEGVTKFKVAVLDERHLSAIAIVRIPMNLGLTKCLNLKRMITVPMSS